MISVIIPAFNAAKTIRQCLSALRVQIYQDFEVVVVDDGSKDETAAIVESVAHEWQKLRLVKKENGGAPSARNRGLGESIGDFVLFCDADIVHPAHALQRLFDALARHPEASFAYSSFKFGWKVFKLFPFDFERLRTMPYVHANSLVRRADLPPGGWDETLKRFQDWDLFLTMAEQGKKGIWVPEVLFYVINTKGTMSSWVPSFAFKLPWHWIGWKPRAIIKYEAALAVIKQKHNL